MNDEARKRWVFIGIMLSIFLAAIESTVVATAMPTVVTSLGGIRIYSWVFSGFLLTQTVTMPLWGRFSDLYGRRPVYLAGLATFLVGSALSGAAQNMVQLILFRMVQGLGAGALMTLGYTIIGELFGLERRARMQGYISSVWGVASLMGPWAGGLLTDHASWRWVFYINLPFGAIAMAVIATALTGMDRPVRRPVVDWAGVALFAAGVSALLLGIVEAGRVGSWSQMEIVALLVLGAAVLVAFVAVERRAAEPIVPLRLFKNRMVLAAVVTRFLAGMAMFGALSFVPLFLQSVTGASATRAGVVLTPFVLGWVVMSVVSARLVLRVGYRAVVLIGMASLTVAFLQRDGRRPPGRHRHGDGRRADVDRRPERGRAERSRRRDLADAVLHVDRRCAGALADGRRDVATAARRTANGRCAARGLRAGFRGVRRRPRVRVHGAGRSGPGPGPRRNAWRADACGRMNHGG